MPNTDAARERLAAEAARLAAETGDSRFAAAAGMLRGRRAGRPPADDGDPLALAASLLAAGLARSRHDAAKRAAALYFPMTIKTATARLHRKLRDN